MHNTAQMFLKRDVQSATRNVQKTMFEIFDILKAEDLDNSEQLKEILQDDVLAKKFLIFHENMNKAIRKKILDTTGDLLRQIEDDIDNYIIEFPQNTELKGIVKTKE